MALSLDVATKFSNLQKRLRQAALQNPDPFTGNIQTAAATAGLIREAANLAKQNNALTGDAVRLNQLAGGVMAEKLSGNAWYSLASHATGILDAILIKQGYRDISTGLGPNVDGPSIWEIQRKYYGASHQPTNEPVTKLPPPPPPPIPPTPAPQPTAIPTPVSEGPPRLEDVARNVGGSDISAKARTFEVTDMADPITGVEDPLSDPVFSTAGRDLGDIRASGFDWRDALAGAAGGYAQGGLGGAITGGLQGGGVNLGPMGQGPLAGQPLVQPQGPGSDSRIPDWLRNLLPGGGGNGNGGDGGGMVPGVFDIGDLYGALPSFGNGQMPDVGSLMLPAVTAPAATQRLKAPKGYVIVSIQRNDPLYATAVNAGGVQQADGSIKVAMDKDKARKRKYWRPRPKPWLTAADKRVLTKANRVEKKVAKAYLKAGIGPKDIKEAKNC